MGKYDFDTIIERRGTGSLKWNGPESELPMWVADMDFSTAPEIREAIVRIAERGVYGYNIMPPAWELSYQEWWQKRHGLTINAGELLFAKGIVPAISSMIRSFTEQGDGVLIQPPVYNCFFRTIRENQRRVVENNLLIAEDLSCSVDFDDLETKLSDPSVKLFILCNPQNPGGRLWTKEELSAMGDLAIKHNVVIISDEIHCDLTEPGKNYQPFAAVNETCRQNSLTCLAPSKTFNLAGIQTSAVFSANEELRKRAEQGFDTDEVSEPGSFSAEAAIAAFRYGEPWLAELNEYIQENKETVKSFLGAELPEIRVTPSEATYLLWLDIRALPGQGEGFAAFLRKETGLYLLDGRIYGDHGRGFLRMNVACPRALLDDGLKRLKKGTEAFISR